MRAAPVRWTVFALALGLMGCGGAPSDLAAGERCVRSTQCAAGLACNMGVCTDDLSGFGSGTVPSADAGARVDAGGEVDGGDEVDSGPPVEIDAGPPGMDAGPPPMDAGTDAGPPEVDAGTDAGPPDEDDAG